MVHHNQAVIDRINTPGTPRCVLITTGGGLGIFGTLSRHGGASNTILEGAIPYSVNAPQRWIGKIRASACSSEVALRYASAAYKQALLVRDSPDEPVFGVGSTSALAKREAEREGRKHHAYTAIQTRDTTILFSYHYPPALTRAQEEEHLETILLAAVATGKQQDASFLPSDIIIEKATADDCNHPLLPKLFEGKLPYVAYNLEDGLKPFEEQVNTNRCSLFSGSWSPRHEAHSQIYEILGKYTDTVPDWEISTNADKGGLDYITLKKRISQFAHDKRGRLFVTNLPYFIDKAKEFHNCTFAVGWDTMSRVLDQSRYGSGSLYEFQDALACLMACKARFLVFGCIDENGNYENIDTNSFSQPSIQNWVDKFTQAVPRSEFAHALRSTHLRERS